MLLQNEVGQQVLQTQTLSLSCSYLQAEPLLLWDRVLNQTPPPQLSRFHRLPVLACRVRGGRGGTGGRAEKGEALNKQDISSTHPHPDCSSEHASVVLSDVTADSVSMMVVGFDVIQTIF